MRYEHLSHKPLSTRRFLLRLLRHGVLATGIIMLSIVVGMIGYEHYEHLAWRDALLNTTMLLGGMGPVDAPQSPGGKLFASFFALYAGLVFIATAGVVLTPVAHRLMHIHNFELSDEETTGKQTKR